MTNYELLSLAARAIGETVACSEAEYHGCTDASTIYTGVMLEGRQDAWNPRDDDGDAMRLAVTLRLCVLWQHDWLMVYSGDVSVREHCAADRAVATRLAIVRAAAALAESKPPNA